MYPVDGTLHDKLKWCIEQYIEVLYKALREKDMSTAQKAVEAVEDLSMKVHGEKPRNKKKRENNSIPLTKSQQAEIAKMGSYGKPS